MAYGAILAGRYVIIKYPDTDHIVMARGAVVNHAGMIIGASAKGTGSVAVSAILIVGRARQIRTGWHMFIQWLASSINTVAGLAIVHDTGVIKDCVSKTFSVVTGPAIFGSCLMSLRSCRRYGVNTGAGIVA